MKKPAEAGFSTSVAPSSHAAKFAGLLNRFRDVQDDIRKGDADHHAEDDGSNDNKDRESDSLINVGHGHGLQGAAFGGLHDL
jgi:hypothetical protein